MAAEAYVGVSGIATSSQYAAVEQVYAHKDLRHHRQLLVGVKATTKTQVDELESTKGRGWFPVGDDLTHAILPHGESVNVLQLYADDWTNLTHRAIPLMEQSIERAEPWLNGLQYDLLPWYNEPSSIKLLKRYAHGSAVTGPVIVQCHSDIMLNHSPAEVVERLRHIEQYITHVLFDASEGRGLAMDPDKLSTWLDALQSSDLDILPAIAGGLDAYGVETLVGPIVARFDDVSWDSESKLHTNNILDSNVVADYISASSAVLKEQELPRKIARDVRALGEFSIWMAHIERRPTYLDGRAENDAEHAYMLAKVAFNIALKYFPELDAGMVAMFANIHDDVEAYTGDTPTLGANDLVMDSKAAREQLALIQMKQDFADFPEYLKLLETYEAQVVAEARFVRILDKSMPTIMNLYNKGKSLLEVQGISRAADYQKLAAMSEERLREYSDCTALIDVRRELIDMICKELFDVESGEHLRHFDIKKDE